MPLLIDWLVQPLGLVFTLLLVCLAVPLLARHFSVLQKASLAAGVLILWLCSAPLPANGLVHWVETPRYQIQAACSSPSKESSPQSHKEVVVLGADLDAYVDSENPYRVLSQDTLIRTVHAASLDTGNNRFYLMGGGKTSRKLADFMATVLQDQGVPNSRIVRDRLSMSTQANADRLHELLPSSTNGPITLVTSSLHMNRAASIFSDRGFSVCPSAAASLYSVSSGRIGLLPFITGLNKSTKALRELQATFKYAVLKSIR